MKNRYLPFLLLTLLVLAGCGEDSKSNRAVNRPSLKKSGPSFRILLRNAQNLSPSDTLRFEVRPDSPEDRIARLEIGKVEDSNPFFTTKESKFSLPSREIGGGEVRLKFTAYFESGPSTTRYKEVRIFSDKEPKQWRFEVVQKYPHDVSAYTQGFLVYDGYVYEGTGNYGESRIRKADLNSGEVLKEAALSDDIFGEGITIRDGKLYQVTYKAGTGFVYDLETFEKLDEFTYSTKTGEGWGLTHNDTCLIMSDGSSILYFIDPINLEIKRRLNVFDHTGNVANLNELEYVDGKIYANIYTQPFVVAIDPLTGEVTDIFVASGIVDRAEANTEMDVLNGIAVHPVTGNLLITGKYWSRIYEVRPVPYERS
jgi:glutamine cyclotransferase